MVDLSRKQKIFCIHCLSRKDKIDRLERDFLVLRTWVQHLRKDVTAVVDMGNRLDEKLAEVKKLFDEEFIGCLEE